MRNKLFQLLFIGIIVEILLFAILFYEVESLGEVYRLSARYTGRISFGLYIIMFYYFIKEKSQSRLLQNTYSWGVVFSVLHIIHFIFLSGSVYLNNLPIIPFKLAGGFLAYLAIIIYPFYVKKINRLIFHLFYFYYVGIVMFMTFLARIRGEFEGAQKSTFHYLGILIVFTFFLYCFITFINTKFKKTRS